MLEEIRKRQLAIKNNILNSFEKGLEAKDFTDNDLEKGLRNTSHLTLETFTDKNGKTNRHWVDKNKNKDIEEGQAVKFEHKGQILNGIVKRVAPNGQYGIEHPEHGLIHKNPNQVQTGGAFSKEELEKFKQTNDKKKEEKIKIPKVKYIEVDKKSYETDKGSIEFKVEINGKTATGYWQPYSQYTSSGVDINELKISEYKRIKIFDGGGGHKTYHITGRLELAEKQPKDLRFTGRTLLTKNLKNSFNNKINEALENPDKEPKLSKEFLDYFNIKLEDSDTTKII